MEPTSANGQEEGDSTPVPPEQKLCRAQTSDGAPCVKKRAHPYSDFGSPKKAHRTADDVIFYGGIKTPAVLYRGNDDDGHRSEADRQTWMRL